MRATFGPTPCSSRRGQQESEVDFVVLGDRYLLVVKVKSHRGRADLTGVDWVVTSSRGRHQSIGAPHAQAGAGAKRLKSSLSEQFPKICVDWLVYLPHITKADVPDGLQFKVLGMASSGLADPQEAVLQARRWRQAYKPIAMEAALTELLTPSGLPLATDPPSATSRRSGQAADVVSPASCPSDTEDDLVRDLEDVTQGLADILSTAGVAEPVGDVHRRLSALQLISSSQRPGWKQLHRELLAMTPHYR